MDLIWYLFSWILLPLFFCCFAICICGCYCSATCGVNPVTSASKLAIAAILMPLLLCVCNAQISISTQSYNPCTFSSNPANVMQCNQKGLYTRLKINITTSVLNTTEGVYEIPWTSVSADTITNSKFQIATNSCIGQVNCHMIGNNTKIRVRVIPTQISYNLQQFGPVIPYGYFFGTFGAAFNGSLVNSSLLTTGPGNCTGVPANFITSICTSRNLLNISLVPSIKSQGICGSNPDSLVNSSFIQRAVNGLDFCQGGVCGGCNANNITAPTMAASFPFYPQCRLFRISPYPYLTVAAEISIENDAFPDTYSVFLESISGFKTTNTKRTIYGRAILNAVTAIGPTVPYEVGPSRAGFIVICGNDAEGAVFQQLSLGARNPLLNVTGGVPTANGMNSTASWYYLTGDQAAAEYGLKCDQNGNSAGMGNYLYNSISAMNQSCTSTALGGTPLTGKCVPGTTYSAVKTPCQIASILNDFSAQFKTAIAGNLTPPVTPVYLPLDWNPNYPNYKVFRFGEQLILSRNPTGRANYPNILMQSTMDVSEQFVEYGKTIPTGIVSLSQSSCTYNAQLATGLLYIVVCNTGSVVGDFTVNVLSFGTIAGYNTTIINHGTTLPITQTITNLSPITGQRCSPIPAPISFTINNITGFLSTHKLPIFIGNVTYSITDGTGTVTLGDGINAVISCDAIPGNGSINLQNGANTTVYSCPSLGDAFLLRPGCVPFSVVLYSFIFGIVTEMVIALVLIICCCSEKNKNKQLQTEVDQQHKQQVVHSGGALPSISSVRRRNVNRDGLIDE